MSYFQDASPESLGISSGGILRFLDRMEEKEHRAAQLYGGAAWEMCGKGLVEAVCTGACAPAVFLWQNPDGNGNRVCTTGKILSLEERLSGSFSGASSEGAVRKSAEGHPLASPDHELRTHETGGN